MKITISILSIVCSIGLFMFVNIKYKLTKKQITLFLLLTLFWLSVGMIRDYRKRYAIVSLAQGGLALAPMIVANITAAYGLVSMFIRMPVFLLSHIFHKRKIFIQTALLLLIVSGIFVYTTPNQTTLYFSSLALGISASLLALFNIVFTSTFNKEKVMISVSILSIAPLMAEFISSAIQYFIMKNTPNYPLLWLFSIIFAIFAFILSLFFKEFEVLESTFTMQKFMKVLKNKKLQFICGIAIMISFIRFSTSGANLNAYAKLLNMDEFYISYIDVVFSLSQLVAGVLMGTYFQRKIGVSKTMLLGLFSSLIYIVLLIFTKNTNLLFYGYVFHGFGYGICYNCLIGIAMQLVEENERYLSMGIFQTFFAIGIFSGDKIYSVFIQWFPNGFLQFSQQTSIFILVAILVGVTMITIIASMAITARKEAV